MKTKKYCIEVPHQGNCKRFDTRSFEDTAYDMGWNYEVFNSLEEAEEIFAGELPEYLNGATFPCVRQYVTGYSTEFPLIPLDKWDAEEEARKYIASDLSRIIVIESEEDARHYMQYNGHQEIQIRRIAREILEEMEEVA